MSISRRVVVLAIASASLGAAPAGRVESPSPETLFERVKHASGREYREARAALFADGQAAVEFLKTRTDAKDTAPEVRWLAAILLERAGHQAEFDRLESVFAEKVWAAEYSGPRITASGRPPKSVLFEPGYRPNDKTKIEEIRKPFGDQFRKWDDAMRLPESPYWKSLMGEVLLKDSADPEALPGDIKSKYRGESLTSDDFRRQAIHLLGRLGETRAGPSLLKILKADQRPDPNRREETWLGIRVQAAEALGRLHDRDALDTLLALAEDHATQHAMVAAVFPAIRRINDPRSIPVLERIAARPFIPNDGKTPNFGAINYGTRDAIQTLRILRGEEKPPVD